MEDPLQSIINKLNKNIEEKYLDTGYTVSYVAFLDILGMKNLVRQDYGVLRDVFNVVESAKEFYSKINLPTGDTFISQSQVKMTIMSDAIVLSIDSSVENAFSKIAGLSSYLIQNLIKTPPHPIFIRGAITKGEIFQEENIVFGPALVEAYMLETEIASSMRCVISDSLNTDETFISYAATSTNALYQDPNDGKYFIKFARVDNFDILLTCADNVLNSNNSTYIKRIHDWLKHLLKNLLKPNQSASIKMKYRWLADYVEREKNA